MAGQFSRRAETQKEPQYIESAHVSTVHQNPKRTKVNKSWKQVGIILLEYSSNDHLSFSIVAIMKTNKQICRAAHFYGKRFG